MYFSWAVVEIDSMVVGMVGAGGGPPLGARQPARRAAVTRRERMNPDLINLGGTMPREKDLYTGRREAIRKKGGVQVGI
jgi:hypothetical protein